VTTALSAGQLLAGVTGSCQKVGKGRQSCSIVGVVGHREVRRTAKSSWQAARKLQLGSEVGEAGERGEVQLQQFLLGEGGLGDRSEHARSDVGCSRRSLTDDHHDIDARLSESPADRGADQATTDHDDVSCPGGVHRDSLVWSCSRGA
jgi:hypothetical protein